MSRRPRLLLSGLIVAAALGIALLATRDPGGPAASAHYAFGHGPTIVLVHGLGSRSGHWLPVARRLARHHHVELVDLPGHGDTRMPAPFSLDRAEAALDRALAEISSEPVILVGHSLGGLVAAAEAIDHPRRVKGLVLVETALKPQADRAERAAMLTALDGDYAAVLRSAYESFGRDSAQGLALYEEVRQLDPASIKPWIRLALSTDLSREAEHLQVPVLAVLAERSWGITEEWSAVAEALGYTHVPNLRPVRIEGCGHFIMLDRPDDLAGQIEWFAGQREGLKLALR
jgi:pimeloyl-ACP methyl ester carboxylesterase